MPQFKLAIAMTFCLFLASQAAIAQTCSQEAIQKSASEVLSARKQLMATHINSGDIGVDVSPFTRAEIHTLKNALSDTTSEYLRCERSGFVDLKIMETALLKMMAVEEPKENAATTNYGRGLEIDITHPEKEPQLVAITISFGIECSKDSILLIYEHRAGTWQQALRWQSDDYSQISGSLGDFLEYVVLPQEQSGKWLVAAMHGNAWCTSRFSVFAVDLLQPARAAMPQRLLQHLDYGYSRDEDFVTKYRSDGFELRMNVNSLDTGLLTRHGIYRFRIADNRLERIQPIAMNGRDFVDEWLEVKWPDARRWSAAANIASLEKEHRRIRALHELHAKEIVLLSYGPVRPCSDDPKHFQVELDMSPEPASYFHIQQGNNSFVMLSAATQPDPGCKGADLMPKR
jgi:hypothetical protein